jgi:hypothetical protein
MYVLYYASMLRCWHLIWILVRTNHPYLGVGCHSSELWWILLFHLLVVGGARNKLGSTLLTLILTPLKINTQFVCGFGYTLLNPSQMLLNHLLAQNSLLKACSQIGNLLLKLGVLFGSMKKPCNLS